MRIDQISDKIAGHTPDYIGLKAFANASVCIPLIEKDGELHILFEVRAASLRRQPGEICFPGGRQELGETLSETARRETCEELLVKPDQVEILGPGDKLISNRLIVHSFAGKIRDYQGTFNHSEVAEVFTVPLSVLRTLKPTIRNVPRVVDTGKLDFTINETYTSKNYPWGKKDDPVYFYTYEKYSIWGMTAKILAAFLEILE